MIDNEPPKEDWFCSYDLYNGNGTFCERRILTQFGWMRLVPSGNHPSEAEAWNRRAGGENG